MAHMASESANETVDGFGRSVASTTGDTPAASASAAAAASNGGRSKSRSRSPDSDSRRSGRKQRDRNDATDKRRRSRSASRGRSRSRSRSRSRGRRSSSPKRSRRDDRRGSRRSRDRDGRRDDVLMSFKEFLRGEPDEVTPEESQRNYEKYKKDALERSYKRFFDRRWQDDWFQEKYSTYRLNQMKRDVEAELPTTIADFKAAYDANQLGVYVLLDVAEKEEKEVDDAAVARDGDDEKIRNERIRVAKEAARQRRTAEHTARTIAAPYLNNGLAIQSIPLYVTRTAVVDLFKTIPGLKRLILGDADMNEDWSRLGWAYYDSQDSCRVAAERLGIHKLAVADKKPWNVRLKPHEKLIARKYAPATTLEADRVEKDLEQARALARHLDSEKNISDNFLLANDAAIEASYPPLRRLNTIIHYLRVVHHYCYYDATEYVSDEGLINACGEAHLRSEQVLPASESAEWLAKLDAAIALRLATAKPWPSPALIPPDVVQEKELTGVSEDEKVDIVIPDEDKQKDTNLAKLQVQWYFDNIKKKSAAKFKCEKCAKMFKAPSFVQKHLDTKHDDEWKKLAADTLRTELEILYMADPNRPTEPPLEASASRGGGRVVSRRDRSPYRDRRRSPDRRGSGYHNGPPHMPPHGVPYGMHPPPMGHPAAPYWPGAPPQYQPVPWGAPIYAPPPVPPRNDYYDDRRRDSRRDSRRSPDRGSASTPKKPASESRSVRSYADLDASFTDDGGLTIDYGLQQHQFTREHKTRPSDPGLHPHARQHYPPLPGQHGHGAPGDMPQYFTAPVHMMPPPPSGAFAVVNHMPPPPPPPPGLVSPTGHAASVVAPPYGLPPPSGMPPIMPPHM